LFNYDYYYHHHHHFVVFIISNIFINLKLIEKNKIKFFLIETYKEQKRNTNAVLKLDFVLVLLLKCQRVCNVI
jgi:hypothetical protein